MGSMIVYNSGQGKRVIRKDNIVYVAHSPSGAPGEQGEPGEPGEPGAADHSELSNVLGDGELHLSPVVESALTDIEAQLTALHTDGSPTFKDIILDGTFPTIHLGEDSSTDSLILSAGRSGFFDGATIFMRGANYAAAPSDFQITVDGQVVFLIKGTLKRFGFGELDPQARVHIRGLGSDSLMIIDDSDGSGLFHVKNDGLVSLKNYSLPVADGTPGQVLVTNGFGTALWDDAGASEIQDNISAVVDPGELDDSDSGYAVKSLWINQSSNESFRCQDATPGVAIWVKTTLTSDELATVAFTGAYDDLSGKPSSSVQIRTITAPTDTATESDDCISLDTSSNNISLTLPEIGNLLLKVRHDFFSAGNNEATITNTVDGEAGPHVIPKGPFFPIIFDGTRWTQEF